MSICNLEQKGFPAGFREALYFLLVFVFISEYNKNDWSVNNMARKKREMTVRQSVIMITA